MVGIRHRDVDHDRLEGKEDAGKVEGRCNDGHNPGNKQTLDGCGQRLKQMIPTNVPRHARPIQR